MHMFKTAGYPEIKIKNYPKMDLFYKNVSIKFFSRSSS